MLLTLDSVLKIKNDPCQLRSRSFGGQMSKKAIFGPLHPILFHPEFTFSVIHLLDPHKIMCWSTMMNIQPIKIILICTYGNIQDGVKMASI